MTEIQEEYFTYPVYSEIGEGLILTEDLPPSHPKSVRSRYIEKYGNDTGLPRKFQDRTDAKLREMFLVVIVIIILIVSLCIF